MQGAVQVTVKLVFETLAGAIFSEKAALIAILAGTPTVGPGAVVAGTVDATRGRVASTALPVVKIQLTGAAKVAPVAKLLAPVTVAV